MGAHVCAKGQAGPIGVALTKPPHYFRHPETPLGMKSSAQWKFMQRPKPHCYSKLIGANAFPWCLPHHRVFHPLVEYQGKF